MSLSPITAFYAGMVYEESETWIPIHDLPDGTFVLDRRKYRKNDPCWYLIQHGGTTSINLCDVPKGLRTLVLLLT